jgi:hypothetical protein
MRVRGASIAALIVLVIGMAAQPAAAGPPNDQAATAFSAFRNMGPHRAFVVGPDGSGNWWTGARDPQRAVDSALKQCEERTKGTCTLQAVNNYSVGPGDWRKFVPVRAIDAPDIGRLQPQPYWSMRGPQLAAGLIVWSPGYEEGRDSTEQVPDRWVGWFANRGYDLYRFDRHWVADWASDATVLASAMSEARKAGYRRILLAGQSAGAWVSLAALYRGAAADGVISVAAAHHGTVEETSTADRARLDWQYLVEGLKPGPRIALVNFADDPFDVGGRMEVARRTFAKSHVDAMIIDSPAGYKGHSAGTGTSFSLKFGDCLQEFILLGKRESPC